MLKDCLMVSLKPYCCLQDNGDLNSDRIVVLGSTFSFGAKKLEHDLVHLSSRQS